MANKKCKECKTKIQGTMFLACSECNFHYDLKCSNVNTRRYNSFYAHNEERKKSWVCPNCTARKAIKLKKICKPRITRLRNITSTPNNQMANAHALIPTSVTITKPNIPIEDTDALIPKNTISLGLDTTLKNKLEASEQTSSSSDDDTYPNEEIVNSMVGHSLISETGENPNEFVTVRGKKCFKSNASLCVLESQCTFVNENSFSALISFNHTMHQSLPDMTDLYDNKDTEMIVRENEKLKTQLEQANNDMIKLIMENSKLEQAVSKKDSKIHQLMQICASPVLKKISKTDSPSNQGQKVDQNKSKDVNTTGEVIDEHKKQTLRLQYKINNLESEKSTLLQLTKNYQNKTSRIDYEQKNKEIKQLENIISKRNDTIKKLRKRLNNITNELQHLKIRFDNIKAKDITMHKMQHTARILQNTALKLQQINVSSSKNNEKEALSHDTEETSTKPNASGLTDISSGERITDSEQELSHKPKLLLLSDFHGTDLIDKISKIRKNDYDVSADIIYHGTTERVLQNLQEKTRSFNKKDCIVIICGSTDSHSNDVVKSVNIIKDTATQLTNTNVVICNIPGSIDTKNVEYNNFVNKFNDKLATELLGFDNIHFQCIDYNLTPHDFKIDGYKLKYSGKFKIAVAVNNSLRLVNEKYYNGSNFLG
ncbi:hypothetical protein O0L34_g17197 [Tuta absoluta]|nr:hypothetical protein O0L34_g17197 [Tuta absoluta]